MTFNMSDELFREGGPHDIKRTGPHEYSFNISIPPDADGLAGRECPDDSCSPGYFKIKSGTGITEGYTQAYCPYCRYKDGPSSFRTKEQIRYGKDILRSEAEKGISRMFEKALDLGPSRKERFGGGFISMEMSYKPGRPRSVRLPYEEELRRDVTCPHCGLAHAVYGIATWCADCGDDIFMTHVEQEFIVVRRMLGDIDRRKKELGPRVAAKDVENCLEDTVSIFEAVLRTMTRRYLKFQEKPGIELEEIMKKIGNKFQNMNLAAEVCKKELKVELFDGFDKKDIETLGNTFEKRHPITHNLGMVDRKYLEKARSGEPEGRDVRVGEEEVSRAIDFSIKVLAGFHSRLFLDAGGR